MNKRIKKKKKKQADKRAAMSDGFELFNKKLAKLHGPNIRGWVYKENPFFSLLKNVTPNTSYSTNDNSE